VVSFFCFLEQGLDALDGNLLYCKAHFLHVVLL
jgi:hypothetical protein